MGNPRRAFLVFDGYAYPYVRGRASVGIAAIHIVPEPRAPLGQDLVRVPIGRLHRVEYRSEEHTSELQSLMRISYAVFCLKKKNIGTTPILYTDKLSYTYHN